MCFVAVGIDDSLEVGKKFRGTLDLIEDGPIGYLTEKGAWVTYNVVKTMATPTAEAIWNAARARASLAT